MSSTFHLHVDDAQGLNPEAALRLMTEFGFFNHHFAGHPEGFPHFEPARHYTRKFDKGKELRDAFREVCAFLKDPYQDGTQAFHGYVEAEVIPLDRRIQIPYSPFNPATPRLPELRLNRLPPGHFRETEIHLTCDYERSDPSALRRLMDMGMFGALMDKSWGKSLVLTAQGSRAAIDALWNTLHAYLLASGGIERGLLKEERILWSWIAHPEDSVPPVIT